MSTEIASSYWKGQGQYPFDFTRRRRLHELNYLVPRLNEIEGRRLLDLGCGDGSLLECLLRLTDFEEFYGVDIAADLMRDIDPRVKTSVFDIASPSPLPEVDALICAGVIQYVFDDTTVADLFGRLKAPVIWVRSTCTLKPERENVHRGDYASSYRTLAETHALISEHFEVTAVDRVYPDEVESKFGTKQFYFEARQRA